MGQAQINVRIRACSRTSIARTKQAALTHNVRGKELIGQFLTDYVGISIPEKQYGALEHILVPKMIVSRG